MKTTSIGPNRPDRELDRRIAALALPALGSIAAEPAYSLADTAIVGHLGRTQLGSLAVGGGKAARGPLSPRPGSGRDAATWCCGG